MMKRKLFKWKYMLAGILLANITACSKDDEPQVDYRQVQESGSRTTELVTQTIELQSAGTLQAKLVEAVGSDSVAATVQKLVLSGPFTSTDMTYLRDSLTNVSVLDMKNVQIKASDEVYRSNSGAESKFIDNQLCRGMFYHMVNLKEVVLPAMVTEIGNDAFRECDSLQLVTLPDGLKTIGSGSFYNTVSLKKVIFPESLEILGSEAFRYCKKISSIKIPGKVKTVGQYCFWGCDSVAEITLSEGVETIEDFSFAGCHLVKTVDFPTTLKNIKSNAFYSCNSLQLFTVPATVTSVGPNFVRSCSNLKAVVWNPVIDVPGCSGVGNSLLFVNTDQIGVGDVNNWKAIVINGVTDATVDVNYGNWNGEFANLKEFTAKKLVYTKYFNSWPETTPGGCSGWQTIVLPFTPDSIYHETKGQIAPFNSGIEGAKPFWLRELTSEGFVDVTKIEANKPYIIAVPTHSSYLEEYRLYGNITFVGRDAVLTVTPSELEASVGPDFELHPTYKYVEQSETVYRLGYQWGYYEEEDMHYYKSFFMKNSDSVQKFNAYAITLGGGRSSRSLFGLDTRSKATRTSGQPNTTGIPQIGDM